MNNWPLGIARLGYFGKHLGFGPKLVGREPKVPKVLNCDIFKGSAVYATFVLL